VANMGIDDTTVGRCGRHVAHAGWFKDASASACSHKGTVIHWAHNWIVGAVTVRLPRWGMIRWVLPVVFTLYRKRSDCTTSEKWLEKDNGVQTRVSGRASGFGDNMPVVSCLWKCSHPHGCRSRSFRKRERRFLLLHRRHCAGCRDRTAVLRSVGS